MVAPHGCLRCSRRSKCPKRIKASSSDRQGGEGCSFWGWSLLDDAIQRHCLSFSSVAALHKAKYASKFLRSTCDELLQTACQCNACGLPICFATEFIMSDLDVQFPDGLAVTISHGPQHGPGHLNFDKERQASALECYAIKQALCGLPVGAEPSTVRVCNANCGRCGLWLGFHFVRARFHSNMSSRVHRMRKLTADQVVQSLLSTYLTSSYLHMPRVSRVRKVPGAVQECVRTDGRFEKTIICSGADAGKGYCGEVLSWDFAVLSKKHCWDAGRGCESAWYFNHLRRGAVDVRNMREKMLAQGPMVVADVFCCTCKSQIGWKFVKDLGDQRNACQVGRFGLVVSSLKGVKQSGFPSEPEELEDLESASEDFDSETDVDTSRITATRYEAEPSSSQDESDWR